MNEIVLHEEVQQILCHAVCEWAGLRLSEPEVRQRAHEQGAMIDGAGAVGPRNWWGLLLRVRTERWIRSIVDQVRSGQLEIPEGSAVHVIAWHREPDGELLDRAVAAVELINVLRPTVAVARFVTFAALALHEHPEWRDSLQAGDDASLECFVQEVRRFYPFFPLIAGRVRKPFDWRNHRFAEGMWVLLDLYGTDHDPRIWDQPETFRPERFRRQCVNAFNFIPQGGGDHFDGHRCAGEWITIQLMKTAVRLLTRAMEYEVPEQDLGIDLSRMPAIPNTGFVIRNVRRSR